MDGTPNRRSSASQVKKSLPPLFPAALLILLARTVGCPLPNPHQPLTMEWTLQTDWQTSPPVATVLTHTHDTSPDFRIDLCQLLPPGWVKPGIWGFGCRSDIWERGLSEKEYYGCPSDGSSDCSDAPNFYCARWGCETFATWLEGQNRDPWLAVKRVPAGQAGTGSQNPLILKIKRGGEDSWVKGKTWGLRLNLYGPDPGILLTIRKRVISRPWGQVGPNQALPHPQIEPPAPTQHIPDPHTHRAPARAASRPSSSRSVALVSTVSAVLNGTNPNITETCWLCLSTQPPFYNGVGVNVSFSNFANISYSENYGSACPWGLHPSITLEEFSGQGTCVTVPGGPRKDPRCAATLLLTLTALPYLLAAPNGTLFACRSGLTPCISSTLFLIPPQSCGCASSPAGSLYSDYSTPEGFSRQWRDDPRGCFPGLTHPARCASPSSSFNWAGHRRLRGCRGWSFDKRQPGHTPPL
uniref:Envelope protein n=1 Tax=Varanus komodoensis TaxID=61221 RepID=A0A8D2J1G0_VARKO